MFSTTSAIALGLAYDATVSLKELEQHSFTRVQDQGLLFILQFHLGFRSGLRLKRAQALARWLYPA